MSGNVAWQPKRGCNYQFHVAAKWMITQITDENNTHLLSHISWSGIWTQLPGFSSQDLTRVQWKCSQTAFSPRRSAWERWSSKISAVVRKIQLPAIVRLMSKFSSWLLPHFLGASQSLAPRPSLLPFFKWQLTFSKPEEERQLFSSGMAPFSKCFQLIKSGPPRITYFRLVQTNRFRTVY